MSAIARSSWHKRLGPGRRIVSLWFRVLASLALYRRLVLLERSLENPIPEIPAVEGAQGVALTPEDVDAYLQLRPDQDRALFMRRLAAGHWCFATRQGGRVVSASWLARGVYPIDFLGRSLPLAPDEASVYDLYTAPDQRRRGATDARAVALMRAAHQAGYRRLLAAVLPENEAGLGSPRRFGYHPIGVVGFVGLGRWRRHFCRVHPVERRPGAPPPVPRTP